MQCFVTLIALFARTKTHKKCKKARCEIEQEMVPWYADVNCYHLCITHPSVMEGSKLDSIHSSPYFLAFYVMIHPFWPTGQCFSSLGADDGNLMTILDQTKRTYKIGILSGNCKTFKALEPEPDNVPQTCTRPSIMQQYNSSSLFLDSKLYTGWPKKNCYIRILGSNLF